MTLANQTTPEQANLRGLEIDKVVKAVTFTEYVFKSLCLISSTSSDSFRWYRKTNAATTLSATAPAYTSNTAFMANPTHLESDVTRLTGYVKEYKVSGLISEMDIESDDFDILALEVMDLTRVIIRDVDTRIWDVITNSRVHSGLSTEPNLVTTSGAWTDGASNPIRDILQARKAIRVSGGYVTQNPVLVLSPTDEANLISYLVFAKGSSIPNLSSSLAGNGRILELAGIPIRVSDNVTADYAVMLIPQVSCTWKSFKDTTTETTRYAGRGTEILVHEIGEAVLQNPKSVCIISNTQ